MAVVFGSRENRKEVEEGTVLAPKFDADGLIPAVAVDHRTGTVLMVAYMNADSLRMTIDLGEAVYWSRSRKEIWHKGATSGHVQKVHELLIDCDQDCLVLRVEQVGAACHVGYQSCFFRRIPVADEARQNGATLQFVESTKKFDPEKVYGKK